MGWNNNGNNNNNNGNWGNGNGNNNGNWNRGNGNNNGNWNNNNNRNNNNGGGNQQAKRSGATYSKITKGQFVGETIVNAWRATKNGMMTATVTPYSGDKQGGRQLVKSQAGHEYQKMICVLQQGIQSQTYHVLMNTKTRVIVIQELSLCITPNGKGVTSKGTRVSGYFGRNYQS